MNRGEIRATGVAARACNANCAVGMQSLILGWWNRNAEVAMIVESSAEVLE